MDSSKISAVWEILLQLSLGDFFLPLKFATLWLKPSRGRWEKFSSCQNICSCSDSRSFFFEKHSFSFKFLLTSSGFLRSAASSTKSYFWALPIFDQKMSKIKENWTKSQKTEKSLTKLSKVSKNWIKLRKLSKVKKTFQSLRKLRKISEN